jgi:hypothetical protein
VLPELVLEKQLNTYACIPRKSTEAVPAHFETFKTVNYIGVIPILVEAIKEQQKEIETKQPSQDVGSGQLVNGKAHIDMDNSFAQLISDPQNVKVFIQLQGDCKGVYVTNITSTGFDVVELNGGTSGVKFFWQAISGTTN